MTYVIRGLDPEPFTRLFDLDEAGLASLNARRVTATADRGFPCRISLEDARTGEDLILLHHTSHDVATPYRSAYAIYVRPGVEAAAYRDRTPPVFEGRRSRSKLVHSLGVNAIRGQKRISIAGSLM